MSILVEDIKIEEARVEISLRRIALVDPTAAQRTILRSLLEAFGPFVTARGTGELRVRFNQFGPIRIEFTDNL